LPSGLVSPGRGASFFSVHGHPLAPDQELRIAINSYRAGGSGGYSVYRGAKVLWRSNEGIRELLIRYYTERKSIPAETAGN
jgi:2',3'-cyclic-nucleotide 2'-phosphodiesterase/3'-nucleotidase